MAALELIETKHPSKQAEERYNALVGIAELKSALLDELALILNPSAFAKWLREHHQAEELSVTTHMGHKPPLVLLEGEVGCGKSELATSIGSPLARLLDRRILTLQTPSDLRGGGHVGELSQRITEAFAQAKRKIKDYEGGILVLDEADDVGTRRGQVQAHHEDRAGVNALIKEIDLLANLKPPLAVILITNRFDALDPAITRRAVLTLRFERPDDEGREEVFKLLLKGTKAKEAEIQELVRLSRSDVPYSYSDLTVRVARLAVRHAWKSNRPFSAAALKQALSSVKPTPLVKDQTE